MREEHQLQLLLNEVEQIRVRLKELKVTQNGQPLRSDQQLHVLHVVK